jgi:hypothetical protein
MASSGAREALARRNVVSTTSIKTSSNLPPCSFLPPFRGQSHPGRRRLRTLFHDRIPFHVDPAGTDFMSRNRIFCAIGGGGILVAAALVAFWWADTFSGDGSCWVYFLPLWQWLRCAIATYKVLAAGVGGATGALIVGWLAFDHYD